MSNSQRIKYEYHQNHVDVFLDGKAVGTIKYVIEGTAGVDLREGYRYQPKGSREHGEFFRSITACQRDIEGDSV